VRVRDELEDAADIVAEADVEHAVHLVEHDEAHLIEVELAAALHVHDAAGCAHHDVPAVLQ